MAHRSSFGPLALLLAVSVVGCRAEAADSAHGQGDVQLATGVMREPALFPPISAQAGVVPLRRLFRSGNSRIEHPYRAVITDSVAFQELWRKATKGRDPSDPAAHVDFSTEMVIAVAMGFAGTTGHAIEVAAVTSDGMRLTVEVVLTAPGSNCIQGTQVTYPVDVVAVPRTSGIVTFVDRLARGAC